MKINQAVLASLSAASLTLTSLTAVAQQTTDVWVPINEIVGPSGGAGTCPQVTWPLDLVGVSHIIVHNNVVKGVNHLVLETAVFGGATDAQGNTFGFNYENHVSALLAASPIRVTVTDHFNLEGAAGTLRVSFIVQIYTDTNGNVVVDFKPNGDVDCDPI
ncbi:MAG TPA: hypothetical protein VFE51_18240 [Verrucomicrobiae bacterium]|nr:hypothetical protein [Verrucomicrobiae bacterium]